MQVNTVKKFEIACKSSLQTFATRDYMSIHVEFVCKALSTFFTNIRHDFKMYTILMLSQMVGILEKFATDITSISW